MISVVLVGCHQQGEAEAADRQADTVKADVVGTDLKEAIEGPIWQDNYPVILTLDDNPVYEPEFRFRLNYLGRYYLQSTHQQTISDWNATQNGVPLKDFFLEVAEGYACKDRAIEALTSSKGIFLSDTDKQEIEQQLQSNLKIYGSYSEYRRIVDSLYGSEIMFNYLTRIDYLGNDLFVSLYGKDAKGLSDQQVQDYVDQMQLMAVRYLYVPYAKNDQQRNEQQQVLQSLVKTIQNSDDPVVTFERQLELNGQEEAMSYLTDGQLIIPAVMGEIFDSVYQSLSVNQISSLVTAEQGFFIMRRMPIFADMTADESGQTLRYWAAYQYHYKNLIEAKCNQMQVEYTDNYYRFDLPALFAP